MLKQSRFGIRFWRGFLLVLCLILALPLGSLAAPVSGPPTLHSSPQEGAVKPLKNELQDVTTALWHQPLSGVNQAGYVDQEFSDYPAYSSYLADDFTNTVPWAITALFSPGDLWNGGTSLLNASALNWHIYADNGSGLPDGDPSGTGNPPFWSITVTPGDARVTVTNGSRGLPSDARIDLAAPVNLPPGTWWLLFYPTMEFSSGGQYGRQVADTSNGAQALFINPGGGFGYGNSWQPLSVIGPTQHDLAFTIEGIEGKQVFAGTVGSQITLQGSDFGERKGKVLIDNSATKIVKDGWAPTQITFIVKKPLPENIYTLHILPKDGASQHLWEAFSMVKPVISSLSSPDGLAGEEIIITGSYFGTKKGKVSIQYEKQGVIKNKNCPVRTWTMDPVTATSQIIFAVPKGLEPGIYPLSVSNKVGSTLTTFEIK